MTVIHPPFVAFPPVILFLVLLLEVVFFAMTKGGVRGLQRRTKDLGAAALLLVGFGFGLAALYTGFSDAEQVLERCQRVSSDSIDHHQLLGRALVIAYAFTLLTKLSEIFAEQGNALLSLLYRALLLGSLALALFTGASGGALVFLEGAGVGPLCESSS